MARKPPPAKESIGDSIQDHEDAIKIAEKNLNKEIENSESTGGILSIPLNKISEIKINGKPMLNRTAYSKSKVLDLADDLAHVAKKGGGLKINGKSSGLLHPIIVRSSRDVPGEYERIIGFRRYKAFEHNNEPEIPAILFECDDKTARMLRTSENRNREDLNPYDSLVSILEELQLVIDADSIQEVVDFLNFYQNAVSPSKKNKSITLSEEDERKKLIIEEELKKFKLSINTLAKKKLIILNLHPEILNVMTDNKINYTNAVIVNKLKDDDLVKTALTYIKENSPTDKDMASKDVQAYVTKLTSKPQDITPISKLKDSLSIINKTDYNKFSEDKKEKADVLIKEIQERLEQYKSLTK